MRNDYMVGSEQNHEGRIGVVELLHWGMRWDYKKSFKVDDLIEDIVGIKSKPLKNIRKNILM